MSQIATSNSNARSLFHWPDPDRIQWLMPPTTYAKRLTEHFLQDDTTVKELTITRRIYRSSLSDGGDEQELEERVRLVIPLARKMADFWLKSGKWIEVGRLRALVIGVKDEEVEVEDDTETVRGADDEIHRVDGEEGQDADDKVIQQAENENDQQIGDKPIEYDCHMKHRHTEDEEDTKTNDENDKGIRGGQDQSTGEGHNHEADNPTVQKTADNQIQDGEVDKQQRAMKICVEIHCDMLEWSKYFDCDFLWDRYCWDAVDDTPIDGLPNWILEGMQNLMLRELDWCSH